MAKLWTERVSAGHYLRVNGTTGRVFAITLLAPGALWKTVEKGDDHLWGFHSKTKREAVEYADKLLTKEE